MKQHCDMTGLSDPKFAASSSGSNTILSILLVAILTGCLVLARFN